MSKFFDEYYVDCVECQHYWNDSCDGVPDATERQCTSFVATLSINVPKQIKALKLQNKWLVRFVVILMIWLAAVTVYLIG